MLEFLDTHYSDFSEAIDYINRTDEDLDYRNQYGDNALTIAAIKNSSEEIVRLLLDRGAKIDLPSENGDTPLIFSARNGRSAVVQLLIEKGADVERLNERGEIALSLSKDSDTRMLLLREHVKVDQKFNQANLINSNSNILNEAGVCYGFNIEITRWLMKHIAKGEAGDQLDVMKKLNRMMSGQKDVKNFITRLELYQSLWNDVLSPHTPISYIVF